MSRTTNIPKKSKSSNRELRVFLSSTFRDMMQERDYLTKQIFPEISNIANERGINFTAIDLRWGVTEEEANQGQVVRICLEEIDRCRPFFIGFLGERYGWTPQKQDIGHYEELLSYFPMVEPSVKQGKSVTEMEILHGVLESESEVRGAFYFRDLAFTEALANQGNQFDYFEQSNEQNEKLIHLKDQIIKSAYPIRHYEDLEKLGQQIKEDLIATLEALFPPQKIEKEIDRQRFIHRNYGENRAFRYLPKQSNLDVLDQFLAQSDLSEDFSTLVLMGTSGIGKSALLSYWMNQLKIHDPKRLTIEHYVGASGNRSAYHLLSRLILETRAIVKQINNDQNPQNPQNQMQDELFDEMSDQDQTKLPEDLMELKNLLIQEIALIPQNQPLLIVIDAINQIDEPILRWFPKILAPNVCLILSSTSYDSNENQDDFKWTQVFETGVLKQFELQPLDLDDRKALIEHYLIHYRKKLSVSQMDKIARNHKSENPLFLVSVLAELQIFGSFEKLDALIDGYMVCEDLAELFERIIVRLENDYGEVTTQKVLGKIWASRYGLSEDELVEFTKIPRLILSPLLLALGKHLLVIDGLMVFAHDYLRKAVTRRYLNTNALQIQAWSELADDWGMMDVMSTRKVIELPWLFEKAGRREDLAKLLKNIDFFKIFYANYDAYELLHYSIFAIKDIQIIEVIYLNHLNKLGVFLDKTSVDSFNKSLNTEYKNFLYIEMLCHFFQILGFYDKSIKTYKILIQIYKEEFGEFHTNSLRVLNNLTALLNLTNFNIGGTDNYEEIEGLFLKQINFYNNDLGNKDYLYKKYICMSNLAVFYQNNGNHFKARIIYDNLIHSLLNSLGFEHDMTLYTLNGFALFLYDEGKFTESISLFESIIKYREKMLGKNHPITILVNFNLCVVLEETVIKEDEIISLIEKFKVVIKFSEKILGIYHRSTTHYKLEYVNFLIKSEKLDFYDAEIILKSIFSFYKLMNLSYPSPKLFLFLRIVLIKKNKLDEVDFFYQEEIQILKNKLGIQHNDTLNKITWYAFFLKGIKNYNKAKILLLEVFNLRKEFLGFNHQETLNSFNSYIRLLYEMNHNEEKEKIISEIYMYYYENKDYESKDFNILLTLGLNVNFHLGKDKARPIFQRLFKQNDTQLIENMLTRHPSTLEFALKKQKNSPKLVLLAIYSDGTALQFASASLRNSEEIVREAIRQNKNALKYASKYLREKLATYS